MKKSVWVAACLMTSFSFMSLVARAQTVGSAAPVPPSGVGGAQPNNQAAQPAPPPSPELSPFDNPAGTNPQLGISPQPAGPNAQPSSRRMLPQGPASQSTAQSGQRPQLGVWLQVNERGVEIQRITPGSAAQTAGLRPGDVLVAVNGREVASPMEVQQLVRSLPMGEAITLNIMRNGTEQQIAATLTPAQQPYQSRFRGDSAAAAGSNEDLMSRTVRLEQQLAMLMQEVQQLRQAMSQMTGGSPDPGMILRGQSERTQGMQPEQGATTSALNPGAAQPGAAPPAPLPQEQGRQPSPPQANQPKPENTAPPADQNDLFGSPAPASQPGAAPAPPENKNAGQEEKKESDSGTDSLFQ